MSLIRTSALTFLVTASKMLAGLVINKAISLFIGPSGLAFLGQFQNFFQITSTFAQGGVNNGVTKYVAEYGRASKKIPILFSTAARISFFMSLIASLGLLLLSHSLSNYFFKSNAYSYIFIIYAFTIFLFVINNLLLSIVNGLKEIKTWVYINLVQNFYTLLFTTLLIVFLGLEGALIALVTNQSIVLLILLWLLRKHEVISWKNFSNAFDSDEARKLVRFSAMAFTSAATIPVSHLLVRNYIGENLGWEQAGYWQAIWYISSMYLMVVTTTLGVYYLPRLSELKEKRDIRSEVFRGFKFIIPIVSVAALSIYALRELIVTILFSNEFYPASELFFWQLTGDVIKVASFLLGYIVIAKAMTRTYIYSEIIFSISFVLLSFFFVKHYGLVGVTYAFALNYTLHLFSMFYLTRNQLN
ncbi:O-antigen translocase [Marinomonas sp.]|uniref:O-antigen translocase n=1 Tax=Marinomonas sp. TaxID=1904862 RepID=UPI003A91FB52